MQQLWKKKRRQLYRNKKSIVDVLVENIARNKYYSKEKKQNRSTKRKKGITSQKKDKC